MITQLSPPIPLHTPRGYAQAHLVIDYGMDQDLQWVCFMMSDGKCWTFLNKDIKLVDNITVGRPPKKEVEGKAAEVLYCSMCHQHLADLRVGPELRCLSCYSKSRLEDKPSNSSQIPHDHDFIQLVPGSPELVCRFCGKLDNVTKCQS